MNQSLSELRREYSSTPLDETNAAANPIDQFKLWMDEAIKANVPEPNAMTLATVGDSGMPAARVVLLKEFSNGGFVFFTNYSSRKGSDLAQNPKASLMFIWLELERQIRIEGTVSKVPREESEAYFHSRPRASQIGAITSRQSQSVPNRETLEARFQALDQKYAGQDIPLPDFWGGYRLIPKRVEFWKGREGRLHDRLSYKKQGDSWLRERLQP